MGVEVAKDPRLKGKPVVTGEERGIATALSYEAKALGVTRGMPVFQIKKQFPQVIILPGDYRAYVEYSARMFEIVRRYADDVEEYSIDECFADLTGLDRPLKLSYLQIAERIKKEINEELRLSVSIGLAPTKVLAKVASKWVKPNGLTEIVRGEAPNFLARTAIEKIWGIGPQTAKKLQKLGIITALDFINKSETWVKNNFSKPYLVLWHELRGEYLMEIDPNPKTVYGSIQKTRTFHPNTNDKTFLLSQLSKHTEEACAKARHYKLMPKKVAFFLKDQNFKYYSYDFTLPTPTHAPEIIIDLIEENFTKVHKKGVSYRTAGVTLAELIPAGAKQSDLFGASSRAEKFEKIHEQIDSLEGKFGKHMVYLASTHSARKRKTSGTDPATDDHDLLFL